MPGRATTTLLLIGTALAALPFAVAMSLLLLFAPSSSACGGGASGTGPTTAAGVPTQYMPFYVQAAAAAHLGPDGWAFLAGVHEAETKFGTYNPPGGGVTSGANPAGAAGLMQIGIGGRATDNWDTVMGLIPPNLPGGVNPPTVYNPADAIYGAALLLHRWGAPGNWGAALRAWNDYPPEIAEIYNDVAKYTHTAQGQQSVAVGTVSGSSSAIGCGALGGGPTTPGVAATVDPQTGLAAIPQGAPPGVQRMIAGGNQVIDKPYVWGGGHVRFKDSGYDCSGAVSYLLHAAGTLASPLDSIGLESYGLPNAGQWVTVYAGWSGPQHDGHTFIVVAGLVLDTVHGTVTHPPGSGPRWQTLAELRFELRTGGFVQRHPPGL